MMGHAVLHKGSRVVALLLLMLAVGTGWAQDDAEEAGQAAATAPTEDRIEPLPEALVNVGIDEHLDAVLPLDMEFKDHAGKVVKLGDYFDGKQPVILTLNYYRCPMLCGLTLNGMVDALKEIDLVPGEQFKIVTVSFDPLETPQLAYLKRQNYLEYYGRPEAGAAWEFLTGPKKSITPLLETTGFRIQWNEERQEWVHLAALIVCTPEGHISRYLYNVVFDPATLRLSLVEASEGKVGSTLDKIILFCYHYDDGKYTLAAMNVVRAIGGLTFIVVGMLLLYLWRRYRRPRAAEPETP